MSRNPVKFWLSRARNAVLACAMLVSVATPADAARTNPNLPFPTLGGLQLWSDHVVRGGWRIQQNVWTGHFRLLDPRNVRYAWGDYAAVRARFDERVADGRVPAATGHTVLLVHGIARMPLTFSRLARALAAAGFDVDTVRYASTRRPIASHADQLDTVVANLDGVRTVSFVTHSMGGLVVRELLSRRSPWRDDIAVARIVMVAPPNQGAALAAAVKNLAAYRLVYGPAGQELVPARAGRMAGLDVPFGVIAGGRRDDRGFNPFLAGDDDGTLRLTETRLDGQTDFLIVASQHTMIADHPDTIAAVISYLRTGRFRPS